MPLRGVITYVASPEMQLREFRKHVKTELKPVVEFWHRKFLPKHFRTSAVTEYKYSTRDEKYMDKKERIKHHRRPLVYTGDYEQAVTRRIRITSTSKSGTGRMPGPGHFVHDRVKDEAVRTTVREAKTLAELLNRRLTSRLRRLNTKQVKVF
jgi:hypothetical protein